MLKERQTNQCEFLLAESALLSTSSKLLFSPSKGKCFINKLYILYITYI